MRPRALPALAALAAAALAGGPTGCASEKPLDLTFEPEVLDFGVVEVGGSTIGIAASERLSLRNDSDRVLYVHSVYLADDGQGAFITDDSVNAFEPIELAPGDDPIEVTVGVSVMAPAPGDYAGVLRVELTSMGASLADASGHEGDYEQVADARLEVTTSR